MTQAPTDRPLYALRCTGPRTYEIAKFSMPDFNVEAVYNLTPKGAGFSCDCPASARVVKLKPCKHQRMVPYMMGALNTNRFFEPTSGTWHQPLSPELAAQIAAEGGQESGAIAEIVGEAVTLPTAYPKPQLSEPALAMLEEAKQAPFAPAEPPKIRRRV